ncbi:MAG TPA: hypothetical protein VGZ73_31700 [Bryobacteraceae bacterium]|nr:hypothetical protein [Bryobacteraceae bacterium]
MGRTPDNVAGFFAGFAANPAFFATAGQRYADNRAPRRREEEAVM